MMHSKTRLIKKSSPTGRQLQANSSHKTPLHLGPWLDMGTAVYFALRRFPVTDAPLRRQSVAGALSLRRPAVWSDEFANARFRASVYRHGKGWIFLY